METPELKKKKLRLLLKKILQQKRVNLYPLLTIWQKKGVVMPLDELLLLCDRVLTEEVGNIYAYMTMAFRKCQMRQAEKRNKVDIKGLKSAGDILRDIMLKGSSKR